MECEEIKKLLIDYMDGRLNKNEMLEVEEHLNSCMECKREYEEINGIINKINCKKSNINIPEDFMNNVKLKVNKALLNKSKKKVISFKVVIVTCALIILSMFTAMASQDGISRFLKIITERESLHKAVETGYGTRVNISKTDKDVKITVNYVVADDTGTSIFFEIEDLKGNNKYMPSFPPDGYTIKNYWLKGTEDSTTWINLESDKPNKNIGKLTISAIATENKNIDITINKIETRDKDKVVQGNWEFSFDVKKYASKTYNINEKINIDGYPVTFTSIKIAPTKTILTYKYKNIGNGEDLISLSDIYLSSNNKIYEKAFWNSGGSQYKSGERTQTLIFDSMYFDNPKDVTINVESYYLKIYEKQEYSIDPKGSFPKKIEYKGNEIVIDNMKLSNKISFMAKYTPIPREAESYDIEINTDHYSNVTCATSGVGDSVYIDKYGNKYDYLEALGKWSEIRDKNPVLYCTGQSFEITYSDLKSDKVLENPVSIQGNLKLIIDGYLKTKFTDKKINFQLK